MHIWLVTIGEPLPLSANTRCLRTGVFARHLVAAGHRVTWITSRFDHYAKSFFTKNDRIHLDDEGYEIIFLDGMAYRSNISLKRQINHIQIARDFSRRADEIDPPDIIVCSFPPLELCVSMTAYAKSRGIPVIIDIRDLWPDELGNRLPKSLNLAKPALLAPFEAMVRKALRGATAIIGVSEAYLNWGLAHAGRPARHHDRVIPLGYPDSVAARSVREANVEGAAGQKADVSFLFVGAFNNSVDLGCLIDAFVELPDLPIRATLAGTGDHASAWAAAASGDTRIDFPGWIDTKRIAELAQHADVGLVCYRPESLVAMPNKIFEYMSFGLPVLNAIPGEAAELVTEAEIGLNYRAGDRQDLKRGLQKFLDRPDMREAMAKRSARTFEQRFSADILYSGYTDLLLDMTGKR